MQLVAQGFQANLCVGQAIVRQPGGRAQGCDKRYILRSGAQAVFVPGVLPGEKVLIEIRRKRKGFLEAKLAQVLEPSEDRVAPPCNGEKECTGATWPYISYPAQLRFKTSLS